MRHSPKFIFTDYQWECHHGATSAEGDRILFFKIKKSASRFIHW